MDKREFTAMGRILCDPIGQRTWIEMETDDLELSVGFKGSERILDRYRLKTGGFLDNVRLLKPEERKKF